MTKEQVEKIIIEIITDNLLGIDEKVDGNSKFFEDIEMDSMSVVSLLVAIEERFNISIDNVTEFTDCLTNVSGLTEYIYNIVKI